MALIKCHECNKEVSTEAKTCPSCGAKVVKPKPPKKPMNKMVKYSLIAVFGIAFINAFLEVQSPEGMAENSRGMAEISCQMTFEKNAKDPSSIDWLRQEREFEYTNDDKTMAISKQAVRAKNSFNALVKGTVICTLEKKGGYWKVINIAEE